MSMAISLKEEVGDPVGLVLLPEALLFNEEEEED
jgi:hypothetical protein